MDNRNQEWVLTIAVLCYWCIIDIFKIEWWAAEMAQQGRRSVFAVLPEYPSSIPRSIGLYCGSQPPVSPLLEIQLPLLNSMGPSDTHGPHRLEKYSYLS